LVLWLWGRADGAGISTTGEAFARAALREAIVANTQRGSDTQRPPDPTAASGPWRSPGTGRPAVNRARMCRVNEAALTLLTLAGVVVLFVSNRVPVEIVAVGSALVV
jgi:hypothetical protein